jgi:cell division protein FtsI/penicillin-binding protein 2
MAKGPSLSMQKKMMFVLAVVFAAGFLILIGRLVKLQIFDGGFYSSRALSQQKFETARPKRDGLGRGCITSLYQKRCAEEQHRG